MSDNTEVKDEKQKNSLGIPAATFVEDVDKYMKEDSNQDSAELVLRKLDEQHSKYKFMEMSLFRKKRILKKQIPDLKTSLNILKLLKTKKESEETVAAQFMISDDLYVKAKVPPSGKVGLWLGANVMLEYTLDDAEKLLTKNLQAATKNMNQLEIDLDFLRDQLTTTEVNMARVYNWDVKRRAAEKKSAPAL